MCKNCRHKDVSIDGERQWCRKSSPTRYICDNDIACDEYEERGSLNIDMEAYRAINQIADDIRMSWNAAPVRHLLPDTLPPWLLGEDLSNDDEDTF